jgi:hypothetical protein
MMSTSGVDLLRNNAELLSTREVFTPLLFVLDVKAVEVIRILPLTQARVHRLTRCLVLNVPHH